MMIKMSLAAKDATHLKVFKEISKVFGLDIQAVPVDVQLKELL